MEGVDLVLGNPDKLDLAAHLEAAKRACELVPATDSPQRQHLAL